MDSLWVAYITTNFDGYYDTDFVGVFKTEQRARSRLLDRLISTGGIFGSLDLYDPASTGDLDEIGLFEATKTSIALDNVSNFMFDKCMKYVDSYYKQKWDFTLKKVILS